MQVKELDCLGVEVYFSLRPLTLQQSMQNVLSTGENNTNLSSNVESTQNT